MKYRDTKLITILRTFSEDEISEFEKFLESPYFRKGRDPLPLMKSLKRFHPEFEDGKFTEENVFSDIYPNADFGDRKSVSNLRALSSLLLSAVEEFLFISHIRKNNILKSRTLLNEILDRNLMKFYPQYLKEAENMLAPNTGPHGLDNLEKHHIDKLNSRYSYMEVDLDSYFAHTSESIEHLTSHYLFELLSVSKSRILGKDNENVELQNTFVEDILGTLDIEKMLALYENRSSGNLLRFQFNVYRFLESRGERQAFDKAKKAFEEAKKSLTRYELVFYYSEFMNMFQTRFFPVNRETRSELLSLMKSCLKDGAYKISDKDFMHPLFYRNVILCSDYLHECEWAYEFIDKYTPELRPELRDNLALYSRALIDYRMGKYEESLQNISKVSYDLVAFKSDVKTLMLRIFYELKLENQALAVADTARHYIKTAREFDEHYRQGYRNFLSFYMKLFRLNLVDSKNRSLDAKLLARQIKEEQILIQRAWLLEKADMLVKAG